MSRSYSESFLVDMYKANPNKPGVALARACVEANLPAKYVAIVLGVTRMTVYAWFRGKPIRNKNSKTAEAFTRLVRDDLLSGRLPAKSVADAKAYLGEMIGQEIK